MPQTQWLDKDFASLWQGRDVFLAAREVKGEVYRQLEQRETLGFELDGRPYFIKKHRGTSLSEILKNLLTLRLPVVSARNEFTAIQALAAVGVSVPRVAAYGCRGLLPAQLESFLVTHDVGTQENLEEHCHNWKRSPPEFAHKLALLRQVADISRRMHGAGICHRDFYLCHFLVSGHPAQLTVIDLHRALVKNSLGQRWIIKDLGALWFSAMDIGLSRRDLLRFVKHYRQRPLREVLRSELPFWSRVEARARKLYNRHAA